MSYDYQRTASDASTVIDRVKKALFQKDYTTALKMGAELVNNQNLTKRVEALHTLYNLQVGARSKHLTRYVGEVAEEVLAKAKTVLEAQDFEALKEAFNEMPL